jgi:hypothetical protein
MVGYINKTLDPGLQLIANQLNAAPNNQVQNVLGNPIGSNAEGTEVNVFKFNGSAYTSAGYFWEDYDDSGNGWVNGGLSLAPGEGAFVENKSGFPVDVTLVGEVQLTSSINLLPGFQVYSSVLPQSGLLSSMDWPPTADNMEADIFLYNPAGGNFDPYNFFQEDGIGEWTPEPGPSLDIAEAFFLNNKGAAVPWARTFAVGP